MSPDAPDAPDPPDAPDAPDPPDAPDAPDGLNLTERSVDVDALAAALAERLRAAAFWDAQVTVEDRRIVFHGPGGGSAASDVAVTAGFGHARSAAERILGAATHALGVAQDQLSEITSDPWPRRGPGPLPDPHVTLDGDRVRLFYGSPADPVLELEPLRIADVLLLDD